MRKLPVDEVLGDVARALEGPGHQVVLQAPPGAGKSTRVPPFVWQNLHQGQKVLVLEPRRVAAQAVASRIAQEHGWELGGKEVGYHVRFDRRVQEDTGIEVMTEGIFLRKLQADPLLDGVGCVILDEFHERSVQVDLALAMLKEVRQIREDLSLVVMSATLQTEALCEYLGASLVESKGRTFPVEVEYVGGPKSGEMESLVAQEVKKAIKGGEEGDILVFASGGAMIRKICDRLSGLDRPVYPLYGGLPLKEQVRAISSKQGEPRVIVSTNLAETSLTVEGVTLVVDTGQVKRMELDAGSGLQKLVEGRIALDSATQRAGRAGRVRPGRALRLWSVYDEQAMQEQTPPQITQADLAPYLLDVLEWSPDLEGFDWFEAPPEHALARGLRGLEHLGAILREEKGWSLTKVGHALRRFPVHPRLGRMVLSGRALGVGDEVEWAAALLSEGDFITHRRDGGQESCDLWPRVEVLMGGRVMESARRRGWQVSGGQVERIKKVKGQLSRMNKGGGVKEQRVSQDHEVCFRQSVARGYSDRVCWSRGEGEARDYVMVGGEAVTLARESMVAAKGQVILAPVIAGRRRVRVDQRGVGERGLVRLATSLEREWLEAWFPARWQTEVEVSYDAELERVSARSVERFDGLVVGGRRVSVKEWADKEEVAELLARAIGEDLAKRLRLDKDDRGWLDRIACARAHMPELGLPDLANTPSHKGREESGHKLLAQWCWGSSAVSQMRGKSLETWLRGVLTRQQWSALEAHFPARIKVPSGDRVRVDYTDVDSPVLAVKLQKLFGWSSAPKIAQGRVDLVLHLLAPNQRPVQVTRDLASFWENTYPEVRKELRARYVKHKWPEKPV